MSFRNLFRHTPWWVTAGSLCYALVCVATVIAVISGVVYLGDAVVDYLRANS